MRSILSFLLVSILCVAGCTGENTSPSYGVLSTIKDIGGPQLRKDAEIVAQRWLQSPKTPNAQGGKGIPETFWTDSIRKLKPEYVYTVGNIITIQTAESYRFSNGIKVYFPGKEQYKGQSQGQFLSGGSGYAEYAIEDGITWYWAKKRQ